MDESLRLAYLEALGIETWVFQQSDLHPADSLSDRAELIQKDTGGLEYDVDNRHSQGLQDKSPNVSKDKVILNKLPLEHKNLTEQKPNLADSSLQKDTPESLVDEQPTNAGTKDNKDPHFAFVSFWTSEGTLLLVELQDPQAPGLSSSEYALLESILFVLKQKPAIDVPFDKELFSWPELVGAHQDRSAEASRQAVNAFIKGKIERQGLQVLLLLGRGVTHQAEEFLVDKGKVEVVSTVSLSEMLHKPSTKASVWMDIQALLKLEAP